MEYYIESDNFEDKVSFICSFGLFLVPATNSSNKALDHLRALLQYAKTNPNSEMTQNINNITMLHNGNNLLAYKIGMLLNEKFFSQNGISRSSAEIYEKNRALYRKMLTEIYFEYPELKGATLDKSL